MSPEALADLKRTSVPFASTKKSGLQKSCRARTRGPQTRVSQREQWGAFELCRSLMRRRSRSLATTKTTYSAYGENWAEVIN